MVMGDPRSMTLQFLAKLLLNAKRLKIHSSFKENLF